MSDKPKDIQIVKSNELAQHLKLRLESQQEPLPPGISYRLRKARQQAVERSSGARFNYWKPVFSFTSVAAIVVAIGFSVTQPAQIDPQAIATSDSEILLSEDDIEFYEDLEFYAWLADNNF